MDELAVADTGTTGHCLTLDLPCDNKQLAINLLPIRMPNREIIKSTYTALLSKKDLPIAARTSHLFPGLNKALLSIRKFCDHGCQATFDDKTVLILNKGIWKVMIKGTRYPRSNLYMLDVTQRNKLMMKFTNPDGYFAGVCMSASQRARLWIINTHHAGAPLNMDG